MFATAVLGIGVLVTSMVLSQGAPEVVALDVLLQVDAATVERAKAVNAQLRKAYPRGTVPHTVRFRGRSPLRRSQSDRRASRSTNSSAQRLVSHTPFV